MAKNPHAVALGRKGGIATARNRTPEERAAIGRKAGLAGGTARAKALSPAKRKAIAKKAAAARWGKTKA